ncbi:hypothetical protein SADUNF_Sadunf10G0183600 [Salix dunnii]|uniref:Uncharacterized protein n=1 Tax=Salix dunnii TaxID=1413687 RepID=A0A835MRH0_9ROSI|nr:hypothetical protein SADUNF_Sadunf10G0183600 [Salix dunnii]
MELYCIEQISLCRGYRLEMKISMHLVQLLWTRKDDKLTNGLIRLPTNIPPLSSVLCKPKIEKGRLEPSMLAGQASILLASRFVSSSVKSVMVTGSLYCQPRLKFLKLEEPA